jgi:ubiquinone/menaquinone biosynthesis C-methylase UbiE
MTVMSKVEAAFCRSAPWRGFARRVVVPWVLADTPLSGHVLELGGGSGAMAFELLRREPDMQLTMTDLDPEMVKRARARLSGFGDRARVVEGDATQLDFPDDTFDAVCSWLMLHHTIRWEEVLAEAVRVTRPGGSVVGYDLVDTRVARLVHRMDRSEHRLVTPDALTTTLDGLALESTSVDRAVAGLVMKFAARPTPT